MKKILFTLISFIMLVSLFVPTMAAEVENGVLDPSFEGDLGKGALTARSLKWCLWHAGEGKIEQVSEPVHSGSKALLVTERNQPWWTAAYNVRNYMNEKGPGYYYANAFVRLVNEAAKDTNRANITLIIKKKGVKEQYNYTTLATVVGKTDWAEVGNNAIGQKYPLYMENYDGYENIQWEGNLVEATLYVATDSISNYYIDDVSFYKGDAPTAKAIQLNDKGEIIDSKGNPVSEAELKQIKNEGKKPYNLFNTTNLIIAGGAIVLIVVAVVLFSRKKK